MDKNAVLDLALSASQVEVKDLKFEGGKLEMKLSMQLDTADLARQILEMIEPQLSREIRTQLQDPAQNKPAADTGSGQGAEGGAEDADDADTEVDKPLADEGDSTESSRYGEAQEDVEWQALRTQSPDSQNTAAGAQQAKPAKSIEEADTYAMQQKLAAESYSAETMAAEQNKAKQQASGNKVAGESSEAPQGSGKKLRIVCPKCSTILFYDNSKLGSVVTCRECGKALKLASGAPRKQG